MPQAEALGSNLPDAGPETVSADIGRLTEEGNPRPEVTVEMRFPKAAITDQVLKRY